MSLIIPGKYIAIQATGCCAFAQLRVVGEKWKDADIDAVIDQHLDMIYDPDKWVMGGSQGGAPTLWCIVAPSDNRLRKYLEGNNWTQVMSFPRRMTYPPGTNELWVQTFEDWCYSEGEELLLAELVEETTS
jgi:hypothetical protein